MFNDFFAVDLLLTVLLALLEYFFVCKVHDWCFAFLDVYVVGFGPVKMTDSTNGISIDLQCSFQNSLLFYLK